MTELWVDIERLVVDGVSQAKATRLASATQMALERLLRELGVSADITRGERTERERSPSHAAQMKSSANGAEAQWAGELAEILYRAIDRSA